MYMTEHFEFTIEERELTLNLYSELKEKSDVLPEAWPFAWENGCLTLEAELGVNDVYFFEVRHGDSL